MIITEIPYTNEAERLQIIQDNSDKYIIQEKNITEGNFLVFSDELPIVEALTLNQKIKELEQLVADLASITLGV